MADDAFDDTNLMDDDEMLENRTEDLGLTEEENDMR